MRLTFSVMLLSAVLWASNTSAARGELNVWRPIGPDGGFILALAVHPTTPTTVYAGTINGGLFKTTNGGRSWKAAHTGLADFAVNAIAMSTRSRLIRSIQGFCLPGRTVELSRVWTAGRPGASLALDFLARP
jgi:hypothetical protein